MKLKASRHVRRLLAALLVSSSLSTSVLVMPGEALASEWQPEGQAQYVADNPGEEEAQFQAFANSNYNYCDAKLIAALLGQDPYRGKLGIGNKIINRIEENIEPALVASRQRGNSCSFEETDYTYNDAQALSNAWGGRISVGDAKLKIAAFATAGQTDEIRQQMAGFVPGVAGQEAAASNTNVLNMGNIIPVGGHLVAHGRQFYLTMQQDGNLVVYRGSGPNDNRGFVWGSVQDGGYTPRIGDYILVVDDNGTIGVCHYNNSEACDYIWSSGPKG